ncbi:MAG TPA: hypothetical protein EYH38_04255 [Leucothrix sp.]|nr:hypothetical protein [Leucothrix sp.]
MNNKIKKALSLKQQKGATMITTLVFLLLMTIVTVSASKISILDMLISSNNQRQVVVFQQTENDLKLLTTPIKFFEAYSDNQHHTTWEYDVVDTSKPNTQQSIESRDLEYECNGFFNLALSIGSSQSPCFLYDFKVKSSIPNTGVRDKHFRGAGKEFPDASKHSTL